jgi:hypothetical protein
MIAEAMLAVLDQTLRDTKASLRRPLGKDDIWGKGFKTSGWWSDMVWNIVLVVIVSLYSVWWWLEHEVYSILFSPIVGMMIQSDELIFFRGVETTNQYFIESVAISGTDWLEVPTRNLWSYLHFRILKLPLIEQCSKPLVDGELGDFFLIIKNGESLWINMNGGWYGYHSQSWVVYDIVLPTWLNSVLTSFQQRWISSFWRFFCADKSLGKAVLMCGRGDGSHWRVDVGLGFKFYATYWEQFDFCWSHPEAMHFAILYLCSPELFG